MDCCCNRMSFPYHSYDQCSTLYAILDFVFSESNSMFVDLVLEILLQLTLSPDIKAIIAPISFSILS